MAVRSGAGTGVVVSLVVFVLTTVFLLVLTIVFYAGKTKEVEAKAASVAALDTYVKTGQRNSDTFKGFEAAAKQNNQSVAEYLSGRFDALMGYVGGDPTGGLEKLQGDMARFQIKEGETLRSKMQDLSRDLSARQAELQSLNEEKATLNDQIAEKDAQLEQAKQSHQQEVDAFEGKIASYRDAAEDYRKRLDDAIDDLSKAKDTLQARYEGRVNELEDETDRLGRELVVMKGKLKQYEEARAASIVKAGNPAMQVDGRIIDAPGSSDEVFIDRGKKDRIVLGMTFEVYGQQSQIAVNPTTGEIPRGKASIQVTKVGETTSTCKITRSTPGNPLIRNDVIANAVYDPAYKFKFLVHGKFDIDADGKPTETEAEYLRSLVIEWGGSIVSGEDLPGDLDFLVLGAEPPKPPPPPSDAPAVVIDDYIRRNQANETYNQLFRQAREAQIPILNSNRFFILIGHTDR